MKPLMDGTRYAYRCYRTLTGTIRLLPDFIIIGAQRSGTTSLYRYLIEHPNIAPASKKEVHFFDNDFYRGISWYRGHFPYSFQQYYAEYFRKQVFITGEASPYYLFHPQVPKRVAQVLPQVKLIVLLRNPVERAFSHYGLAVRHGYEKLSFADAIACEEERTRGEAEKLSTNKTYHSFNHLFFSYLARGIYADQLQTWFSLFPREQFLVLKSEDMYTDPAAILKQTLEFLNVPCLEPKTTQKDYKRYGGPKRKYTLLKSVHSLSLLIKNKRYGELELKYTPPKEMDPALRHRLVEFFEPHNARLYALLGRDFEWN